MNILLEEISRVKKENESLKNKIILEDSRITVLEGIIKDIKKKKEELRTEREKLVQVSETDIIFLIKVNFSGQMSTASEYWDYVYYNYSKDNVFEERVFEGCSSKYKNIINVKEYFPKDVDIETKIGIIREICDNLIEKFDIRSWSDLKSVIKGRLEISSFRKDIEEAIESKRLQKKL